MRYTAASVGTRYVSRDLNSSIASSSSRWPCSIEVTPARSAFLIPLVPIACAAIDEARTHGMRVAAHAIGTNGIKNALRAGVTSIEHGHLLDDEAIELFKSRETYLVPTLAAVYRIYENIAGGTQPDFVVRKATELYQHAGENIRKAYRAGVKIAGGSDAGTPYNRHEDYAYEVELMSTVLGMSPQQALTAATATAAELIGVDAGVLAAGRPADLLLLAGVAGRDVRALRDPRVVVKGGAIAHERR